MSKNKTAKWVRDTNGDRYCAWHLVSAADAAEHNTDNAIASVYPEWGACRAWGIGKPSHFRAVIADGFKEIGKFDTIRAATRAIDTRLVLPLTVGTKVRRVTTGETGTICDTCPTEFAEPMYAVQCGNTYGIFKPSEIEAVR